MIRTTTLTYVPIVVYCVSARGTRQVALPSSVGRSCSQTQQFVAMRIWKLSIKSTVRFNVVMDDLISLYPSRVHAFMCAVVELAMAIPRIFTRKFQNSHASVMAFCDRDLSWFPECPCIVQWLGFTRISYTVHGNQDDVSIATG